MSRATSRAVRRTLALALPALAACADEPSPTSPGSAAKADRTLGTDVFIVNTASGGTAVGSIRWAATVATTGAIIRFDPSLDGATINLDSTLRLVRDVTIEGPKDHGITLSGGDSIRVMHVNRSATLRNLTITRGYHALSAGGIWSDTGTVTLEHSTVSHNVSPGVGAIRARSVKLVNSTVANNVGSDYASGIAFSAAYGVASLINSTVAHNWPAPGVASFDLHRYGDFYLQASIIAGNGLPRANCGYIGGGGFTGLNISDDETCLSEGPNMLVADPKFGTLGDHGGPTHTLDFDRESPALNGGEYCTVAVDQRYVSRDAKCDVGAFEFTDFTKVTLTIDPGATVDPTTGTAVVTGTVACTHAGDQFGVRVQLRQQKGGKTPTVVEGTGGVGVTCTTSAQSWRATVTPASDAFDAGSATATASTNDIAQWITPATTSRSVKLVRSRK